MLHKVEMDEQELHNYRVNLHNNTVTSMQVFVEAADRLGLTAWENEEEEVGSSLFRKDWCRSKRIKRRYLFE